MLDRGATMSMKDPINYMASTKDIVTNMLNNHSYTNFRDNQIDNTAQDTFVYKTDE